LPDEQPFVKEGVGEASVWSNLKGGRLLGEEAFISKLIPQPKKHEKKKEITKSQRYMARPRLNQLFGGRTTGKLMRDLKIKEAMDTARRRSPIIWDALLHNQQTGQ
jgi:hypothetical protein